MKGVDHEYSKVPVCVLAVLLSAHGSMNKAANNNNNIFCRIYDIYGGLQSVSLGIDRNWLQFSGAQIL